MWLLSTDRAELHYFARNFDATGGYAILSHTWNGNEQTFQEIRAIGELCHQCRTNPRDFVHPKIRNCCKLAEKRGYRWVWIDSCCIDKTSSSELSEAINSMFRWYKEAEVCFAYLADVSYDPLLQLLSPGPGPSVTPADRTQPALWSAFRKSRWHARGWTLQELIAPDCLIFLSVEWRPLGNRAALATLLEEITRVPSGVLTGENKPTEYSVSCRMSWASMRRTTRVEDEAYCLMGLFGVRMPTNYGEGKQAFIRLQYEIMQHDSDISLFAFGYRVKQDHDLTFKPQEEVDHYWKYLMADTPRQLNHGFDYVPDLGTKAKQQYPPSPPFETETAPFGDIELPSVAVTSYGIQIRLPVYEDDELGITIAVILCRDRQRNFGLFLTRDSQGKDPKRPRYFTCCVFTKPGADSARYVARMADLGDDLYHLTFNGKPVTASWRTIYIVPTASDLHSGSLTTPDLIINCNPKSRFRIPRWLIARFTTLHFEVNQVENTEELQAIQFFRDGKARIFLSLGICAIRSSSLKSPPLWAKVDVLMADARPRKFTHDCSSDHIDSESWATRSKVFWGSRKDRGVQLSLSPSARKPYNSFVIHLELLGHTFVDMLREDGLPALFPPLKELERKASVPVPHDLVPSFRSRTPSKCPINLLSAQRIVTVFLSVREMVTGFIYGISFAHSSQKIRISYWE
ncbi:hypothetical protein GSI_12049 [Ganoderma sinense ZZ0214-1]|uniref:Uncharacterized protein n=1 Tax=Ganoderma sinense ZZ0214-1 TaxID=1077348 RepID=A0A2G8RXQ0_9APHY|nr:hypothetical protein GSI_12049 [Ganoderma sinense ZZ0214-1]